MNDYQTYSQKFQEYGEVTEINYPIITAVGLPSAKLQEIVLFENGEKGQIITLLEEGMKIMLFARNGIKIGSKLARTDSYLMVPLSAELLGNVITPLGDPIDPKIPPFP
ncbi:MAG: hypothetical protein AAB553_06145, partial [Patescibacteria group bacterium]